MVAAAPLLAIFAQDLSFPAIVLAAPGLGLVGRAVQVATHGWQGTLAAMAWSFTKAELFSFGGAYAVLPCPLSTRVRWSRTSG